MAISQRQNPSAVAGASQRIPINACDTATMESDVGLISWTSCVEVVEVREDALILHIRWLPQFPPQAQVDKPSDAGNDATYLLDGRGAKYHHMQVGGDAARDVTLVSGRYYRGQYTFPRPNDLSGTLTFVEEDVDIQVPFTLPPEE